MKLKNINLAVIALLSLSSCGSDSGNNNDSNSNFSGTWSRTEKTTESTCTGLEADLNDPQVGSLHITQSGSKVTIEDLSTSNAQKLTGNLIDGGSGFTASSDYPNLTDINCLGTQSSKLTLIMENLNGDSADEILTYSSKCSEASFIGCELVIKSTAHRTSK